MKNLLIKNVIIIDSCYPEPIDTSILIQEGKIKEIKRNINIPENTQVIDGDNQYILPGFIDMHSHIMGNGFFSEENMKNPLSVYFYNALNNAKDTIDAGITTLRDCGLADIGVKMVSQELRFPMPKLVISVCPLTITRGHFDYTQHSGHDMRPQYPGMPRCVGDGEANVLRMVRECIGAGADFIKVIASGGVIGVMGSAKIPEFNMKELKTIVNEAKSHNLKVSAHSHSLTGINNCIKAGMSSIEHATFIDRKAARLARENKIPIVPTLIVQEELYANPKKYKVTPERMDKLREIVKVHHENISIAYEENVNILMGTDCGVIDHGLNLKELVSLVDIGMTEKEAIAAGTIEAAKFMNMNHIIGSIEVSKDADLVLTDKNPLDDISHIADKDNINMVIREGKILKNKLDY